MPRDDEDNLVYDGALGWIDPEDIMGSLAIEVVDGIRHLAYYRPRQSYEPPIKIVLHKDTPWAIVRAIVDDAEYRCTGRVSS